MAKFLIFSLKHIGYIVHKLTHIAQSLTHVPFDTAMIAAIPTASGHTNHRADHKAGKQSFADAHSFAKHISFPFLYHLIDSMCEISFDTEKSVAKFRK